MTMTALVIIPTYNERRKPAGSGRRPDVSANVACQVVDDNSLTVPAMSPRNLGRRYDGRVPTTATNEEPRLWPFAHRRREARASPNPSMSSADGRGPVARSRVAAQSARLGGDTMTS